MPSAALNEPARQATVPRARLQRPLNVARVSGGMSDEQSAFLQGAFKRSGGVALGDELALFLRSHCDQPVSMLARWIVQRQVVSFVWRSQTLIPMFQFELKQCSVRAGMPETIAELMPAFDDAETVAWFARPNCWLADAAPADVMRVDAPAVLHAARADRFIALG
ncbi:MAG: hypothetical protein ABI433_16190 [Burkholderiaceae bacterium]